MEEGESPVPFGTQVVGAVERASMSNFAPRVIALNAFLVHTVGIIGAPKKTEIQEKDLHDFKHFKLLPAKPHDDGCRGLSCPAEGRERRLNWGDWGDRAASLVAGGRVAAHSAGEPALAVTRR